MEDQDKDDMGSLFEGMVLFNPPSQMVDNGASGAPDPAPSVTSSDTAATLTSLSSQPLDENLFSDLTVISPDQSDQAGPNLLSETKDASVLEIKATAAASFSRQSSRKKKKPGMRIGYGRDVLHTSDQNHVSSSIPASPAATKSLRAVMELDKMDHDSKVEDNEDFTPGSITMPTDDLESKQVELHSSAPESESTRSSLEEESETLHDEIDQDASSNFAVGEAVVSRTAEVSESIRDDKVVSGTSQDEEITSKKQKKEEENESGASFEIKYEHIKAEISEKLARAREMTNFVSSARKDSRRRRRKAVELVDLASQRYRDLEKQLEEACENEDFETADKLSEKLADTEQEKQHLLSTLKDAEADSDAIDSKMQEALEYQIAVEEECICLMQCFSLECASNANLLFEKAEAKFSMEMDEWFASVESLEAKKMELEITSDLVSKACTTLNNSIEKSVENDKKERDVLHQRRVLLGEELERLLILVRAKEAEIAETDSQIEAVDKKIAEAVSGFEGTQSGITTKFENVQSDLSQIERESEALSVKKKEIDEFLSREKDRGESLRKLASTSEEEAKEFQENLELRKSLMHSVVKSRDEKVRLACAEEKILADIQNLRQEVSAARSSLQDLSSRKSNIQQEIASFKQRTFFIDKRLPELETEKKVAASARNFKEAARIAGEAKTLSTEKEEHQTAMEEAAQQLLKVDKEIDEAAKKILEIEGLITSMEGELAITQFQQLRLLATSAKAERAASLELGDLEEANVLLAEAEAVENAARQLQSVHEISLEKIEDLPAGFVSVELASRLDGKQLAELNMTG